ncbi:caspase family protein [Azohydromonas caseinilytica]|uniref:Caspase family protein n=1 Tax=Azohydromonas caseinilytica TaxID=2728836 RepID=A0A848F5P9_9BURK|nr:caspase family protein [Azohydromonas caseinilytica]NML13620.1 caspase family protein [Azohydromonas caseinilytica]
MSPRRLLGRGLAVLLLLLAWAVLAPVAAAQGREITETRVALVIGNAAYRSDPLDNPVNDARLMADVLKKAGFEVTLRQDLDRAGLLEALRGFGSRLDENTVALLYYAGHGLQLRDRNYLIPVDAEIRSEDEIPIAGIDIGFILGRMAHARSRINLVILDACRNNPFLGKTVAAQGLAQMDAPVGTLLAYATAPGKLAADSGSGANSVYASYLAKHLLTPGLPVEQVFKRVREGVVRETQQQQVPWESSSLQGEFAFVPGVGTVPGTPDIDAAGEIAFWNSIQASNRAEEYRAYLRQYPQGRFSPLAQARVAALTPAPAASPAPAAAASPAGEPPQTVAIAPATVPGPGNAPAAPLAGTLPRPGDRWRYRVQDQFRIGDLFVSAQVEAVTPEGVAESWSTTSDAKLRTAVAALAPGFHELPGWTLTPPEFSPYLQAAGGLQPGQGLAGLARRVEQVSVPLKASVEGEEEIQVAAGRFRAVKLVLRGQATPRGGKAVRLEQVVWYAPAVKRMVKSTVSTSVGGAVREATSFELVEYQLH